MQTLRTPLSDKEKRRRYFASRAPEVEEVSPETKKEWLIKEGKEQTERVKLFFPTREGIIEYGVFSSKIISKRIIGDEPTIDLAVLIENLFNKGKYAVLEIDPNVNLGIEGVGRLYPKSDGPKIRFYFQKENLLIGELTVEMSTICDEFYAEEARIRKYGSKNTYRVTPHGLSTRMDLTTEEAINYLRRKLV